MVKVQIYGRNGTWIEEEYDDWKWEDNHIRFEKDDRTIVVPFSAIRKVVWE